VNSYRTLVVFRFANIFFISTTVYYGSQIDQLRYYGFINNKNIVLSVTKNALFIDSD
jgi:hypothetical protein